MISHRNYTHLMSFKNTMWTEETGKALSKPLNGTDGPTVKQALDAFRREGELPVDGFLEREQLAFPSSMKSVREEFDSYREVDDTLADLDEIVGHVHIAKAGNSGSSHQLEVAYEGDSRHGSYSSVKTYESAWGEPLRAFEECIFTGDTIKTLTILTGDDGSKVIESTKKETGFFRKSHESTLRTWDGTDFSKSSLSN